MSSKMRLSQFNEIIERFEESYSPSYIKSAMKIFTREQKTIIFILHESESPLTTKEIYNEYIKKIAEYYVGVYQNKIYQKLQDKKRYKRHLSDEDKLLIENLEREGIDVKTYFADKRDFFLRKFFLYKPLKLSHLILIPYKLRLDHIKGKDSARVQWFDTEATDTKGTQKTYRLLKKSDMSPPSFEKLNQSLLDLNKLGLVDFQESTTKKIKGYWCLNPKFDVVLKAIDRNIVKMREIELLQ